MTGIMLALHVLAALIWVGGMFFAYVVLRPVAAQQLQPPQRLGLWVGVFDRFFSWVFASIAVLLGSGLWMVWSFYGGFETAGWHVRLMTWIAIVMMLIFLHVFFAPFRRLKKAVRADDWPAGALALGQIRMLVAVNLLLGLGVVAIASGGRLLQV